MDVRRGEPPDSAVPWTFRAGDPLRGLGALGVLLIHVETTAGALAGREVVTFPQREAIFGPLAWVVEIAAGGLYVFFVLSGFLVGRPFVRAFVLGEPFPPLGVYVRNRLLRIVPMLWVTVALTLLFFGTLGSSATQIGSVVALAHIWLPSNPFAGHVGHAWTLDVEILFYLALPFATLAALRLARGIEGSKARSAFVVVGATAVAAAGIALRLSVEEPLAPPLVPWALASFAWFMPGIVLAAVEPGIVARLRTHPETHDLLRFLAPAAMAIGVLLLAPASGFGFPRAAGAVLIVFGSLGVVAGPLLLQWATGGSWSWLDNPVTRWLGARSYSIYLLHFGVVQWMLHYTAGHAPFATFAMLLALVLLVTLPAADLGYRLVERPFLRRKRRSLTRETAEARSAAR
jgi:peptidoglycan/LPS O-acetylase OafA/YrhL